MQGCRDASVDIMPVPPPTIPPCRQVIADAVLADPFEWNEAVLGKEPAEYCRWIKVSEGWGRAGLAAWQHGSLANCMPGLQNMPRHLPVCLPVCHAASFPHHMAV